MNDMNNEKNKSAVILNPERSKWVSRSHVTSVEAVVNDGAKTKPHHALRRSLRALAYGSTLKMTFSTLTLAAILCFGNMSEALAEIKNYQCGENCTATLDDNGVFTISGSGKMTNFGYNCEIEGKTYACDAKGNIRPWENELKDIKTIKFAEDSEITSIGSKSFISAKNLTEAEFQDSLEKIEYKGMKYAPLSTIILPDTLKSIESEAFAGTGSLNDINIICMGNEASCAKMKDTLSKYCNARCNTENAQIVDLSGKVSYANSEQCNGQKYYYGEEGCTRLPAQKSDCLTTQYYYWNGKKCSKFGADENIACASGFVEWENACLDEYPFAKKRWTPAEANEWLHDGNDNFVVITFKK